MKKFNIAIIDDCEIWRTLIKHKINQAPKLNIVMTCSWGEDFFNRYKDHHIDLVLLDISLPITNGYEIAIKIRELLPSTPIVVFTSSNHHRDIVWFETFGIAGYINKSRHHYLTDDLYKILRISPLNPSYNLKPLKAEQLKFISLICSGLSNKQIADELHTVEKNVEYKLKKLSNQLMIPNNKLKIMEFAVKYGYW